MLQRQVWRPPNSHLRSLASSFHGLQRSERSRCSTISKGFHGSSAVPYNKNYATNADTIRVSQRSVKNTSAKRRYEHSPGWQSKSKSIEQWIKLGSLSETLNAHRAANQDGAARDGIPVKQWKIRRTRPATGFSPQSSWPGSSILRPAIIQLGEREKFGYSGQCPPLLSEWRPSRSLPSELRFPWLSSCSPADRSNRDMLGMHRLEMELQACDEWLSPSTIERNAANSAFDELNRIISQCVGLDASTKLIGSRAAGTDGPISDLDVYVSTASKINEKEPMQTNLFLQNLERSMRQPQYRETLLVHTYLKRAQVPIIVGTHLGSGLEFQIQSSTTAHDSLEVTKAFIAEYATSNVVFKVIKQILAMRGLTKASLGGVTSYPLLNMVVTSLKLGEPQHGLYDCPAASSLLQFCDFWSNFDFEKNKISYLATNGCIDPISTAPKVVPKDGRVDSNECIMSLEDPADPMNDLGRSTYGIKHVQACLIEVRSKLQQALQHWDMVDKTETPGDRTTNMVWPLLGWCLGGDYTSFGGARWQLQRYAQRLMDDESVTT